jgi:hypothetical protein
MRDGWDYKVHCIVVLGIRRSWMDACNERYQQDRSPGSLVEGTYTPVLDWPKICLYIIEYYPYIKMNIRILRVQLEAIGLLYR